MKKAFRIISAFLLVVLQVFSFAACKAPENSESSGKTKYVSYYFDYFDTVTTIIGYEESKEEFDAVCAETAAVLEEYHKLFTIYNRYSDLNNMVTINTVSDGEHSVVEVDEKIIDMLLFAKEMYSVTSGKVNIAMGSVLSIWHVYRNEGMDNPSAAELPPMTKLESAAEHTDIEGLVIDAENNTVHITDPAMRLDVGAIAKGYAVEKAAQYLIEKGVTDYILNVGGNIRTIGNAGDAESPWKVGIENPDTSDTEKPYIEYLKVTGKSVVTSGSYQRYYVVDGKSYHHIIDPETLMPGQNYLSVSVLCDDSGLGDAFSTALFLMSYEEGAELVENTENLEAMWVMPDGEQRYSSGFKAYTFDYEAEKANS